MIILVVLIATPLDFKQRKDIVIIFKVLFDLHCILNYLNYIVEKFIAIAGFVTSTVTKKICSLLDECHFIPPFLLFFAFVLYNAINHL